MKANSNDKLRILLGEKLRERVKHLWKQSMELGKILSSLMMMKTMMMRMIKMMIMMTMKKKTSGNEWTHSRNC